MMSEQLQQLVEANEGLVLAIMRAHAQRAADEKKIRDLAHAVETDALTHLPNRQLLLDRLGHAIVNAKRCGDRLALLFIDLNKFKQINDTLGHAAGDQVLKTAAQCLTSCVRESDTVSRHGGDEFVILLEKVSGRPDVTEIVEKILAALGASNRVGSHAIRLTASVGISLYPDDGNEAEVLFALADRAMYAAKRDRYGSFVFAGISEATAPNVADAPLMPPFVIVPVETEQRHVYRRSADEQMVSVTLAAQELQADAEKALRRQTEFMAVLAHELRNPLGPIRNAASLIGRGSPDPAVAIKVHDLIERQVTQMTKLLDDVFDMSRIATGKMRMESESVDIVTTIRQAVDGVQFSMDARRQTLHCTLPDCAVQIVGDPVRLVQIFANLLDNASKYTPEDGPIALIVEAGESAVVVKVIDSGIGITAEALPNVFQLFVQDAHAARFNGRGLGIGLALVKNLVEAHHGAVTAHSDGIGHGSAFTVTLPTKLGLSRSAP